jgi:hypothetical protein
MSYRCSLLITTSAGYAVLPLTLRDAMLPKFES